jgi:CBS domain containing-hemolysin-like protein
VPGDLPFTRRTFDLSPQPTPENGTGGPDRDEAELLSNFFALGSIRVRESMVPRTDIVAVEEHTDLEELRQRFLKTGHSKLPVYRENIDHIVGVVFAFDLFGQPPALASMVRPAKFVPESKLSKELLKEFLTTNTSIAIVIDEYGGTAGLVTREDLLEELFGDIQDEFDTEEAVLRQLGDGLFIASGRVYVDELRERYDVRLSEGDYETVAGYLLEQLGSIPAPQEEFVLDGYRFAILQATPNRIDLVRITRLAEG